MGRIIKGPKEGGAAQTRPQPVEVSKPAEGGRLIEKDVYKAQLLARDILKDGEQVRRKKLEDGRKMMAQVKEEALASGAVEAFNEAGKKAIEIFGERARYLFGAEANIRTLAKEIVQKILGTNLQLEEAKQKEIISSGLLKMRAKRKLTLQFPNGAVQSIQAKTPGFISLIEKVPDIDLVETGDVREGYVRIVTDSGNALCHEAVAIKALQTSLA